MRKRRPGRLPVFFRGQQETASPKSHYIRHLYVARERVHKHPLTTSTTKQPTSWATQGRAGQEGQSITSDVTSGVTCSDKPLIASYWVVNIGYPVKHSARENTFNKLATDDGASSVSVLHVKFDIDRCQAPYGPLLMLRFIFTTSYYNDWIFKTRKTPATIAAGNEVQLTKLPKRRA